MKKEKSCKKCGTEMYQDDQGIWFCPDCIIEEIDPAFLDEKRDHPDELKRSYVLSPPTKQVSIRIAISDLELARKLARRKGVPKYQTYIKTLLHEALTKESQEAS
jgi:uncharacterized Zn finger protein (UPF0148 family)